MLFAPRRELYVIAMLIPSPFSSPYDRSQQHVYHSQLFKSSCGETFQLFFDIQDNRLQDASFTCSASQLIYQTLHTLIEYCLYHPFQKTLALEQNELLSLLGLPAQKNRLQDVTDVMSSFKEALREALHLHSLSL